MEPDGVEVTPTSDNKTPDASELETEHKDQNDCTEEEDRLLSSCSDVFQKAVRDADQAECEPSPATEPYKAKYAARKVLENARETLSKSQGKKDAASREESANASLNDSDKTRLELAMLDIRIGVNLYLTEENTDGERSMRKGAEAIEGPEAWNALVAIFDKQDQDPAPANQEACNEESEIARCECKVRDGLADVAIQHLVSGYNFLGVLWSHRADGDRRARRFLRRARAICEARFGSDARLQEYTSTLFFLAQVEAAAGNAGASAELCGKTLYRQHILRHSYEPFSWITNAFGLASYFLQRGQTRIAAHCVCAAGRALDDLDDSKQSGEQFEQVRADLLQAKGNMYAQVLRIASAVRDAREENEPVEAYLPDAWASIDEQTCFVPSKSLDKRENEDICVPAAQEVATFEAARELFNVANTCFVQAKRFYVLDGYVTAHLGILQSQSGLYKDLAAFETDPKRLVAMHGRREKLLADLLDDLNPEVYLKEHQEIAFELGSIAHLALNSQLTLARASAKVQSDAWMLSLQPAMIKRVNQWAMKMVRYYGHFCKMFEQAEAKDKASSNDEETGEEYTLPYLSAHFWTMHAFKSMIPPDPRSVPARVLFLQEQVKYAKLTSKLASERLAADSQAFQTERQICKDIAELIASDQPLSLWQSQLQKLEHSDEMMLLRQDPDLRDDMPDLAVEYRLE
ncbi:KIF1-binding protein [Hondaea fermentalgiana]|uniref:KIF-binding protein n=1 Tax=Hondaea fermentalgiana TaxID=2315210 RepID=A0A2R5GL60_9STRA|nr:KIF1-binding protein [Hondaea fermentalgiana]|eukprot:GBG31375.1 KIF1-binding protein [Hondaea fermentalgiana]